MGLKIKNKYGEWTGNKAIQTSILDLEGNFESTTVEGALRELAEKTNETPDFTEIETKIEVNKQGITVANTKINQLQEDVEWLKVNGGGGGGSVVPTITSTFEDCDIDKGSPITIPIFFSSPSGGNGTAYIVVNNVEVDSVGVKQGNNNITVLGRFLTQTDNKVAIYVRDRAGIASNQLEWNVIAGGIELSTTFEYELDYGITDQIMIPYTVNTGISGDITLYLTIDGVNYELSSVNGYNYFMLNDYNLGLGTHSISMYATVDKYTSKTISFNVAIVSTTELYLSSTFVNGSKFTYGVPISVNYRLSKKSTETYNVYLYIDNNLTKTQSLSVGSYYWTLPTLEVGRHDLRIKVVSLDETEIKELELWLEVEKGVYTPVEDYTYGLICDLNASGRTNQDSNSDTWVDETGNGHDARLVGFNFATNGFINDELVCDNDAYVEIPWSPWSDNAPNGSTIDIIYTPINSGIEECRVLDYTYGIDGEGNSEVGLFKGIFADITQTIASSSSSGSSSGKVTLDDESGEIHLTWVLDRTEKFMKIYINGILSRIMFLKDSISGQNKVLEDFSHNNFIYLNSEKGNNCGTNNIKRFRVYNHALSSDQIIQNHLANIKDLNEQEKQYNFNYNNTNLPKMYLTGDTTNMTPTQTVDMKIKYVSPNEEKYGSSFETGIQNNPVRIQGTSSLNYARHNYTIFLKDEFGSDMMYNPYGSGSVADNVFCLKADYIDSSHANNTGLAKFVNDKVYTTKINAQLDDPNCRTTICGFPIELYLNGEYLGIYNFNHDRYSVKSYGYDRYPNMLVYEISSNTNTSAGAFYRYGEDAESSKNKTETEYYAESFQLIHGNRTSGNDTYAEIKELVEWVSIAEQDLFREAITEHFDKEYLFRYLLTVLMVGGVDSLGKNCKLTTYDGKKWFFTFYDLDTSLGIDNSGYLRIGSDVEIEPGSFNTANSNLWRKVMEYFDAELKQEWKLMRQGSFTLDNIMEYVYGSQIAQISAKHYNMDAEVKYLPFGSLYTSMCHGSKEHLVRRWLRERIAYVDSMMGYFGDSTDTVIVRAEHIGNIEVDITTYIPLYYTIKWKNGLTETKRIGKGETVKFSTYNTATDQEVILYYAKHLKKIENLSTLNPSSCKMGYAKKLTELEIHSDALMELVVEDNTYLRRLDIEGCKILGSITATQSSLNLTKCKYLKYLNAYDTGLTDINFSTLGGSLREIYYPKAIQSVVLNKQSLLEVLGLPYGYDGDEIPTGLYKVDIKDCPNIIKANTSDDPSVNTSLASMIYCNTLTLRNSLGGKDLSFKGFKRLKNATIENMYELENLGLDDLAEINTSSTLKYLGVSNCPKLTTLTMNCNNNLYDVAFDEDAILNLGSANALTEIRSNTLIKGLKTIVLPKSIKNLFFTGERGNGVSSIENLWSSSVCGVNTEGETVTVTHQKNHTGIDFKGLNLDDIDLTGVSKIVNAINFNIAPINKDPKLNSGRDGTTEKPWFRPSGTIDLTKYKGNIKTIFRGLDLDKVTFILPDGNFEDTDISHLFEATLFKNATFVNSLIARYPNANNLNYILAYSDITDASSIQLPTSTRFTLKGGFMGSKLRYDIDLPLHVVDVTDCFRDCKELTSVTKNWDKTYNKLVYDNCYTGCTSIVLIDGVPGTLEEIPFSWGGYGFSKGTVATYIVDIPTENYTLILGDLIEEGGVIWGDGEYSYSKSSHIYKNPGTYTIKGKVYVNAIGNAPHSSLTNVLKNVTQLPTGTKDFSSMFQDCAILNLVRFSNSETKLATNTSNMFKNCISLVTTPDVDFTNATNIDGMYSGCVSLVTVRFNNLAKELATINNLFDGCSKITTLGFSGKTHKTSASNIIHIIDAIVKSGEGSLYNVTKSINNLGSKVDKEQELQNNDIVLSMIASTDIFEMLLAMIGSAANTKGSKLDTRLIEVYVSLIEKGIKNIDEVPVVIRSQVLEKLGTKI